VIFIRVPQYNRIVLISSNSSPALPTATAAAGAASAAAGAASAAAISQSNCVNYAPFSKHDTRLRGIPFMTFRPTFNEVKRAHTLLSRIELFGKCISMILSQTNLCKNRYFSLFYFLFLNKTTTKNNLRCIVRRIRAQPRGTSEQK
jgi:hypothetical protein